MVRKISLIIFSAAILFAGFTGAKRLRYWERSVWIFKISEQQDRFDRRGGGNYGRPEESRNDGERDRSARFEGERERSDRQRPVVFRDSIRAEFELRERSIRQPGRNEPDSLRHQLRVGVIEPTETGSFERGRADRDQHGRGGFRGRKKVSLRNVGWFLAVFASFTVIIIYQDKLLHRSR